jgi:hypothetical protein
MNLAAIAAALALAAAPGAEAAEPGGSQPGGALTLKPKSAISTGIAPNRQAPFALHAAEPEPEYLPRHDGRATSRHWSCSGERSFCYDPDSGRVVYKPARALMPDIPGLQRENLSVKRDRIMLRYSF